MPRLLRERRCERGAALVLVAMTLTVVLLGAGLAVDLSSMARQGQTLQNAADAASLAGAVRWATTGDAAAVEGVVADILAQNGMNRAGIEHSIDYPSSSRVEVVLRDTDPDSFFAGFVPGTFGSVERGAVAEHLGCSDTCATTVEIPPPFSAIEALGSGDGYQPVFIGWKVYGVNHHSDTIACVDRRTQAACFVNLPAFPAGDDAETDWTSLSAVVGERIYFLGDNGDENALYCWNAITDSPCPKYTIMDEGGGFRAVSPVEVGDQVYAVTDDHRMHCLRPSTGTSCPGYGAGGRPTGMETVLGFGPLDSGDAEGNNDRMVDLQTGRIYYVLKIGGDGAGYTEGAWVDCWDTASRAPCPGFTPVKLSEDTGSKEARIFLHHTPAGTVDGVCLTGGNGIDCADLTGTPSAWMDTEMGSLEAHVEPFGNHVYHPPSNRAIFQFKDLNWCWDFTMKQICGSIPAYAMGTNTKDYAFNWIGDCIVALGHNSIFWSFNVDMTSDCRGTALNTRLDKCSCDGVERWPAPVFAFVEDSAFVDVRVRFLDPSGNQVWPIDEDVIDLRAHGPGAIDLSEVSTDLDHLVVDFYAEIDPLEPSPWDAPEPPAMTVQVGMRPRLVE